MIDVADRTRTLGRALARMAVVAFAACTETHAAVTPDASTALDMVVPGDAEVLDIEDGSSVAIDALDIAERNDIEPPDTTLDTHADDIAPEVAVSNPPDDVGCTQELPECPPGDVRTATDLDGDGCPDACCFSECPTDFVPSDFNGDGCGDSCGDKPCTAASDCTLYACAFAAGNCSTPKGVCSNFACQDVGPVCGCDGVTYETGCLANAAGVPVATDGECSPQ